MIDKILGAIVALIALVQISLSLVVQVFWLVVWGWILWLLI